MCAAAVLSELFGIFGTPGGITDWKKGRMCKNWIGSAKIYYGSVHHLSSFFHVKGVIINIFWRLKLPPILSLISKLGLFSSYIPQNKPETSFKRF